MVCSYLSPSILPPIGRLRVTCLYVEILWWKRWVVVFDDWLNHLGGFGSLLFSFRGGSSTDPGWHSGCFLSAWFFFEICLLIFSFALIFLSSCFSFEHFGLVWFWFFLFKNSFLAYILHGIIFFFHFLIRIYIPVAGFPGWSPSPLRRPFWVFLLYCFLLAAVFWAQFFFFPSHIL